MSARRGTHRTKYLLAAMLLGICLRSLPAQFTVPAGTEPTRILTHYMPWYMAMPHSRAWGWHWTMGAFDPERRKKSGRRRSRRTTIR